MSIRLLRLAGAHCCPYIDVIRLHLYVLKDAIISFPDNDSQLILIERRRSNWMGRSIQPFLLLDEINKGLNPSLRPHAVL